ncbi:MAG: hypothetical protein ACRDI0_07180 [Actinomycetota bacterium]
MLVAATAVAVVQVVRPPHDRPADRSPGAGPGATPEPRLGGDTGDLLRCLGPAAVAPGSAPPATGSIEAQVGGIADGVEAIRELEFEEPVDPTFLGPRQTAERVRRLLLADYTPRLAEAERRMLAALGAVPRGIDVRRARAEALGEQVAGFYLPGDGELVVRADPGGLGAIDRITLAHELQHALADQNLELPVPERLRVGREDEDLAALALVEGDATLTMQRYALTLPLGDQLGLLDPSAVAEARAGLDGLPYYLRQELLFPYEQGLAFVCDLYGRGGWGAVNDAYGAAPRSTAEVLFAGRYAEDRGPVDPPDPPGPGGAWTAGPARSFGAANLLWLLEAPGGRRVRALDRPQDAAAAWAGGEVHLWQRGPDSALALVLAERPGHDVLCRAVSTWYASAFPGVRSSGSALGDGLRLEGSRQDAVLTCTDDLVQLSVGPDPATAGALAA